MLTMTFMKCARNMIPKRKVEAYFSDKKDEESIHIREGVYALISNVLFVPDRKHPSMYHPRIAVQNDFIFGRLDWKEKDAFNRLYNHYYYQRHNQFWYQEAMKKLPILTQATSMLVCGEDLGMVPDCVPWVMDQLQILSLEIQRMPKNPKHEFGHVWNIRTARSVLFPLMTCLLCGDGGKKIMNRPAATTTM